MNRSLRRTLPLALAVLTGCSMFRWSGRYVRKDNNYPTRGHEAILDPYLVPSPQEQEEAFRIRPATAPVQRETFSDADLKALYYYDMGPTEIDVSHYPQKHQEGYAVFREVCSRCHTLARPINSPRSDYYAWDFYVFTMRLRGQFDKENAFTKEQAERIVDFLSYDGKVRKGKNRVAFEVLTKQLQHRFDKMLAERIHRLQEGPPVLRGK